MKNRQFNPNEEINSLKELYIDVQYIAFLIEELKKQVKVLSEELECQKQ